MAAVRLERRERESLSTTKGGGKISREQRDIRERESAIGHVRTDEEKIRMKM